MNRRQFFKRAAIVAAGAAAAPLVGKAPEAPEAFAGTPDTGVAINGGGCQFIVDGKTIGTIHSVEFTHPIESEPAPYYLAGKWNTWSQSDEWYDDDGGLWKNALLHPRHDA